MRSRLLWTVFALAVLLIVVISAFLARFSLSALEEPGRTETSIANRGRHFLIRRAGHEIPPAPKDSKASVAQGDMLYGVDCSMCHGRDGHGSTDMGRWMYPRAADLTSSEVQSYSDSELFWIIKNGIRLSGMPAFGRVESDEHIWDLVNVIRTFQSKP